MHQGLSISVPNDAIGKDTGEFHRFEVLDVRWKIREKNWIFSFMSFSQLIQVEKMNSIKFVSRSASRAFHLRAEWRDRLRYGRVLSFSSSRCAPANSSKNLNFLLYLFRKLAKSGIEFLF